MSSPNTDLLPPLFDQILAQYEEESSATYTRADIIKAFENGVINAAAERERLPGRQGSGAVELNTFDRLSGDHLSRAALSDDLQRSLFLSRLVVEIALLLIEAQIDLRLKASGRFKLAGIEFQCSEGVQNV